MSKIFTKLNLGAVAYSSGGKCFKRLTTEQPTTLAAGLYDANDNLVASWDTLVNTYGMDCERDYSNNDINDNYITKITTSPWYVLTNNGALANGVKLIIDGSVTNIGKSAFLFCSNLRSVVIPDSVMSINDSAFSRCSSLVSIKFAENGNHTSMGDYVFYKCSSLTSVAIPNGVTSIGASMFAYCSSLTSIEIPDSVTSIAISAFYECTSLTSIRIPDSVTSIGGSAFSNCTSLTSIKYRGTEEQWNAITKGSNWDYNTGNYTITYNYTGD